MGNQRGSGRFDKPPLSSEQLVDLVCRRGLVVEDRAHAARVLFHIGYYRLAPYIERFDEPGNRHCTTPGTTFDDVVALYKFDRDLRALLSEALAGIEVAFRSALSEIMSTLEGDSHWYTKPHYFATENDFKVLQGNVAQALDQPFPALADYLRRYKTPELPPSWLMVEVLSLGQLVRVYRTLKQPAHRRAVAKSLGLANDVLESWLETFLRVRNICAHHERLWDVTLSHYPLVPHSGEVPWPGRWHLMLEESRNTLYCVASALQSLLTTIAPHSPWASSLANLLEPQPMEAAVMGFPTDWTEDPFWSRAISAADPDSF